MIHIGTSGYSYSYWKNRFYPEGLPASKWLGYYCTQFNTLELNNTFYRFPTVKTLKKAADITPCTFRFSVKAHKIITHTMRMKNVRDKITEFMDVALDGLGNKLACILYQLPPSYSYSEERLDDILESLANRHPGTVIEFRHSSWWQNKIYKLLHENQLSFCSVSYPGLPEDNITDSGIFYKRMHGVPELFKSPYTEQQLQTLAKDIPEKKQAFIYFNNTTFEAGYTNAGTLKRLSEKRPL